jgi:hypothetical protein
MNDNIHLCYKCMRLGGCPMEMLTRKQSVESGMKFDSEYSDANVIKCPEYIYFDKGKKEFQE